MKREKLLNRKPCTLLKILGIFEVLGLLGLLGFLQFSGFIAVTRRTELSITAKTSLRSRRTEFSITARDHCGYKTD